MILLIKRIIMLPIVILIAAGALIEMGISTLIEMFKRGD